MPKLRASKTVDVARDAVEAICIEGFRLPMSREIERGERFSRDADLVKAWPQFFGLLLPMSELQEVNQDGR